MKINYLFLALTVCLSCTQKRINNTIQETEVSFFIGTYTSNTKSEGIYRCTLSNSGTFSTPQLIAKLTNPSFLAFSKDKGFLLSTSEIGDGEVHLFKVAEDSIYFINKRPSGGAYPCHVAINSTQYIVTANYMGGNVGLLRIENDSLSDLLFVQQHEGSNTSPRQEAAHAHSAWFLENEQDLISVDLGTNELWFSHLNGQKNELLVTGKLGLAPGAGPRHLAVHPNQQWFYVLNELNGTVTLVEKSGEQFSIKSSFSTLPKDFKENNQCADIHISSDGKFLYASNRGHNSIAIFKIDTTGMLTRIGLESVRGDWPRNFTFSPDENFLLVANKKSNNIISFRRDKTSGLLTFVEELKTPAPVCLLF